VQVVGDDLLVTAAQRIRAAGESAACNAALIKPNQVGTITEKVGAPSDGSAGGPSGES